ncbi:hypothetical protein [Chitinophaga sp. HK235]|uniref:hypothetical protein n=1 Tax=Chitinophaga sp. HK235 TaxID=2952571 RepID=UPI001BA6DD16|nr:hypothetical protein [Chitinophaga sp. HK235]
MKTLTCILVALLLLSATPASVEKKVTARRSNVTVHVWFYSRGTTTVFPICGVPLQSPKVYQWGVQTVDVNCPSSSVVLDVTEGQTLSAAAWLDLTHYLASDPLVVSADMIGAGSIDLIIEF